MTTFALTLPLDRISPVRVPTRDLVLGGTDSVTLLVSIVDRDSPDALPIALTGGIGGPALSMFVWPDSRGCHGPNFGGWGCGEDYGWGGWYGGGVAGPGTVMWSATGTVYDTTTATFAIVVPAGTMGAWPRRCRWAIYFDSEAAARRNCSPRGICTSARWSRGRGAADHADGRDAAGADRHHHSERNFQMTTTITTPGGAPVEGVRIADMPDLGAVTDRSIVVGDHAGSGTFRAPALRDYVAAGHDASADPTDGPFGAARRPCRDDRAADPVGIADNRLPGRQQSLCGRAQRRWRGVDHWVFVTDHGAAGDGTY